MSDYISALQEAVDCLQWALNHPTDADAQIRKALLLIACYPGQLTRTLAATPERASGGCTKDCEAITQDYHDILRAAHAHSAHIDAELKAEDAAKAERASQPPHARVASGCIGCGDTVVVGFTINREPGPFCHDCWSVLKVHVAQVNLLNHHVDGRDNDVDVRASASAPEAPPDV
jgi:hypothetical protein